MDKLILNAEVRPAKGKEQAKKLRNNKTIPAVVYGRGSDSVVIQVSEDEFQKLIRSSASDNPLIQLNIKSGESPMVLIKEVQRDSLTSDILHLDFHRVVMDEKITVTVPLDFSGDSPAEKEGGVLEKSARDVELSCFPDQIPENIVADISALELGQSLHVSDLPVPEGAEIISDPEMTVVTAVMPKEEVIEEPVAAEGVEGEEVPEGEEAPAEEAAAAEGESEAEAAEGDKES